ncbi:MAG TPA: 3-dehydroquinate synthase [Solirubrobacteraceae bacterium]|nr:3-dehydroquinate synthase [Solirubrobacteraceae bacterium]
MGSTLTQSLVLVGFMGSGKSTAARSAAGALRATAVDLDREVEARLGRSIPDIFATDGEAAFREAEERIALELLGRSQAGARVLALGGGTVGSPRVREALREHLVVWLDVDVQTAWERCAGGSRPLARDRGSFARLHAERDALYAEVADIVIDHTRAGAMPEALAAHRGVPRGVRMLWACSASGDYPAYIGPGLLGPGQGSAAAGKGPQAPAGFWPATVSGRRFVVCDQTVGRLYGERLGPAQATVTIPPGERSKSIAQAEAVWMELAKAGMTRADVLVALGGGVVGDLAGFCAATYQRGVPLVQVPTTLVAQVDSAYGGKTGVDLPHAKNYVGAFHQPRAVIADTDALATLPPAELAAGYAEVVKTALIAGGWLWELVRGGADWDSAGFDRVIAGCAHTKLRIVASDERDAGLRQVLNLGHTVGHAIESTTGYAAYRHGEAVALGLLAALRLSGADRLRAEVAELLQARRLPTRAAAIDPRAVVEATGHDKKRVGRGGVPFVLLSEPGRPQPGCIVPERELAAAVRELAA